MLPAALLAMLLQDAPVFRADVRLMTVPCAITDARGIAVRDLKPDEFRLYDNGVLQQIRNVWIDRDLPLMLGAILDASASQRAFLREHQDAVQQFQTRMMRPQDRSFVAWVNEAVILKSETHGPRQVFLPRGGELLGEPCPKVRGRSFCGGTALWNAVYAAAHLKMQSFDGSKALVILSDGNDTGSIRSLQEALDELHRAGIVVYVIRYPDPLTAKSDSGLQRLATETGGLLFDPPGADYAPILERIEADLRSHYVLGFQPAAEKHQLKVEVTRPGVTVR